MKCCFRGPGRRGPLPGIADQDDDALHAVRSDRTRRHHHGHAHGRRRRNAVHATAFALRPRLLAPPRLRQHHGRASHPRRWSFNPANDVATCWSAERLGGTEARFAANMTAPRPRARPDQHALRQRERPAGHTSPHDGPRYGDPQPSALWRDFPQYYHYFSTPNFAWRRAARPQPQPPSSAKSKALMASRPATPRFWLQPRDDDRTWRPPRDRGRARW